MLKASRLAVVATVTLTSLAIAGVANAAPVLTYHQIAAMSPEAQAAIMNPLRAIANAAGTVGRAQGSDVLAGIQIEAPSHTVAIYLTDLGRQNSFRAAMQQTATGLDLRLARFVRGDYPITALKAAADSLVLQPGNADLSIESVVVPSDGSALHVRAYDVTKAKQALAVRSFTAGSIPMVFEKAPQEVINLSRRRDTPSWISGEAIGFSGTSSGAVYDCTSGLPARRKSDNRSFLITAAHCYGDGASIYTGWESGGRNWIGTVVGRSNLYDAIAIDTGSTGATLSQEWDGPANGAAGQHVYDVSGTAWSYSGDMTCQDGYSIGIRCGLLVTSGYITWTDPTTGYGHAGVEAHQVDNGLAGLGGDSGGLVFALTGGTRQARGIVSARSNYENLRWTEAPVILSSFGFSLAP